MGLMEFKNPPVNEMSLAVQFRDHVPSFTPNRALRLHAAYAEQLPTIELHDAIPALGAPAQMVVGHIDPPRLRWWFTTEDGSNLVQFQSDMVAVNWRRRGKFGIPPTQKYGGYELMRDALFDAHSRWTKVFDSVPQNIAVCSVYYDNLWPAPNEHNINDIFAFWNKVGLKMSGPDVQFQVPFDKELLPLPARIEVTAGMVGVMDEGKPHRAARLLLIGYGHPEKFEDLEKVFDIIHRRIGELLEKLTTEQARARW